MNDELISRPTFKNRLEKKESIIETKFIAQFHPRLYFYPIYTIYSRKFFSSRQSKYIHFQGGRR